MLRHQIWIALVASLVFFTCLGAPRLWDDDESKNARCAQEMLVRGDWVVPTFNFRLRPDKPALFYWLAMISYELFGQTELAARLPSALLAVGTCLATYHLGRRLFGARAGLWAGLAMATNGMFAVEGRMATPDSTLIFCTTAALLAYVIGVGKRVSGACDPDSPQPLVPRSLPCFVALYAAMGLAVLAKGPVGVVLPVAAIGGFVWFEWSRRRSAADNSAPAKPEVRDLGHEAPYFARLAISKLRGLAAAFPAAALAMRPLLFVSTVLAVALPWYAWVAARTHGVWWREFFWDHNVQRFLEPREGHHGWLLFPPLTLMAAFFPWSMLLPAALAATARRIRREGNNAAALRLMLWWSAAWIVFFSICGTKQPNYILPAYPALAAVVGMWVADWIAVSGVIARVRQLSAVWAAFALSGVALSIAIVVLARWYPAAAKFAWIGVVPIAGGACAWFFERRRRPTAAMGSLTVSAALLLAALLGGLAAPVTREQNGVRLAEIVASLPEPPSKLGQFRLAFVGLVYYANQKVEELGTADEAAALFSAGANPLIATDPEGFEQLRKRRPGELQIIAREPRYGRHGDMVLVARLARKVDEAPAEPSWPLASRDSAAKR